MLAEEENKHLTEVGPGTAGGELLRRYWHPIAPTVEVDRELVLPVRLLGENLALFRTEGGNYGLVQERCAHRAVSLTYGIPGKDGIHCPYHGWYYGTDGACLSQPYEDIQGPGTFKQRIRIAAYPVQELGGLLWAYLGPQPAPELPRWDLLVEDDRIREVKVTELPCNYVQIMENSLDPVHFEWLHAELGNFAARKKQQPPVMVARRHLKIEFDEYEYGLVKRRLVEGDSEDSEDWTVGHPVIFPNTLAQGTNFQFRVPMDDTHTLHIYYNTRRRREGEEAQTVVPAEKLAYLDENGRHIVNTIAGQDMMAWVTQGPTAPRDLENVGRSDRGVLLYRRMLTDNIERVARGDDPKGVIRDPAMNEPMIAIQREKQPLLAFRPAGVST